MTGLRLLPGAAVLIFLGVGLALGSSASARSLNVIPLVEHWDGTSWSEVAVPSGGTWLDAVVAPSATDVWAFGPSAIAEHWDGTSWHSVSLPIPAGFAAPQFLGAAADSPDDIWAVGEASPANGPTHAIIDHWNGERWQLVPGPPARSELYGVAALSANDVWAVGDVSVSTANGFERLALTLHWNGAAWTQVPTPNPAPATMPAASLANILAAVAGSSSGDVWAVGSYYLWANGVRGTRSLVLHWDGTRWTQVSTPDPLTPGHAGSLDGVSAPSATGAWAVGWVNRHGARHALAERWNGERWSIVHTTGAALGGVSALAANDAWAAGAPDGGGVVTHWNGHVWTVAVKLDRRRGLSAVAEVSPTDVWAVGGLIKH